MKKAINAWSMDGALTFEQSFAAAKKAGFDGIELNVDAPGSPHSLTMDTTEHELGKIASLSEKYALPVVSISTSLYGGKLGGAAEEENEFAKTLMLHQIRCAKALGAGAVLTVPGADLSRVSMKQCRARAIALLSDAAEEVEASGITVGLENVWNGFFMSPFDMRAFIEEIGSPRIRAYFDVGNVAAFSYSEHWIEVLSDLICRVHVKDYRSNGLNCGGDWADLLNGSVRWENVMRAFRAVGFDGYLTAEVFPTHSYADSAEFYSETARQLEKILAL